MKRGEMSGEASRQEREWLPISLLNAYAYCPRRFYYEFTMAEMVVNEHVLEGQMLHERVDLPGNTWRDEKVQLRHIYLCAPALGIVGYCDLLEREGTGHDLAALAMQNRLYPVEYKKGKMGKWLSDHTQLCAQALALEEVLQIPAWSIRRGYVFYVGSARRDEVSIDAALREGTLATIEEARALALRDTPPLPITNWRKCRDCSLEPICLPREVLALQSHKVGAEHGDSVSD
ncbi:MAG TPA: CRISPR-associated protein Cas4 [Ktedonobacteraceae bacterium]|jgi:CRISPR-associated exonuclease Cas4|nr:CRISPR-associated protein Cas4 [Ktedonobacteraceae bacterium]